MPRPTPRSTTCASCSRTRCTRRPAARFKVYIIDEVHMLSRSAFNAMLKTLEEPPEHVKFILATTDPQKIPVTVLSRCLQFNLKQMPPAQISEQLEKILAQEDVAVRCTALDADRARRARQHARRLEPARSGDRARRRARRATSRCARCSAASSRNTCATFCRALQRQDGPAPDRGGRPHG